jgi:hypothetical protein
MFLLKLEVDKDNHVDNKIVEPMKKPKLRIELEINLFLLEQN